MVEFNVLQQKIRKGGVSNENKEEADSIYRGLLEEEKGAQAPYAWFTTGPTGGRFSLSIIIDNYSAAVG